MAFHISPYAAASIIDPINAISPLAINSIGINAINPIINPYGINAISPFASSIINPIGINAISPIINPIHSIAHPLI